MQLIEYLRTVPLPILVIVALILIIVTIVMTVQFAKIKGLDGIRNNVYQLMLKAEHVFNESGQGQKKLKWVVQQARGLLPKWLQIFVSEQMLMQLIDRWFKGVKDLLDDGKVNSSQQ